MHLYIQFARTVRLSYDLWPNMRITCNGNAIAIMYLAPFASPRRTPGAFRQHRKRRNEINGSEHRTTTCRSILCRRKFGRVVLQSQHTFFAQFFCCFVFARSDGRSRFRAPVGCTQHTRNYFFFSLQTIKTPNVNQVFGAQTKDLISSLPAPSIGSLHRHTSSHHTRHSKFSYFVLLFWSRQRTIRKEWTMCFQWGS